jgi:hypothetical protein
MATTEELAKGFYELFPSYQSAHGSFIPRGKDASGKMQGEYLVQTGPLTIELWKSHLDGSGYGLGGIALLEDNNVSWGALDIDEKGIDLDELCQKILDKKLPLVVCTSKSAGAHCYLFLKEPQLASLVIEQLQVWAAELGHGDCEIFPKQATRTDKRATGNFINLPYHTGDDSPRHGYTKGQGKLTAEDFLKIANVKKYVLEGVEKPYQKQPDNEMSKKLADGPPCLQRILKDGKVGEGIRNKFMFNLAIYCKRKFADDWVNKLFEYNYEMCDPPLDKRELETIEKQLAKKDYEFQCNECPLSNYCDRKECVKRRYGVGAGDQMKIGMVTGLTQYKCGGETTYDVQIDNNIQIMMTPQELLKRPLYEEKLMTEMQLIPPSIANGRWKDMLRPLIAGVSVVHLPDDFTIEGEVIAEIAKFLASPRRGHDINDCVVSDLPWHDHETGVIWVTAKAIMNYLNQQRIKIDNNLLWHCMRRAGGEQKDKKYKKTNKSLWFFDMPEAVEPDKTPVNDLKLKQEAPF